MDDGHFDALTKALAGGVSRRTGLRLLTGGITACLARRNPSVAVARDVETAAACKRNTAKCDLDVECCSGRCRSGRCRRGRLRRGAACTRNEECRSEICGRINAQGGICRSPSCLRAGRSCVLTPDCCRGVCDAATLTCVD